MTCIIHDDKVACEYCLRTTDEEAQNISTDPRIRIAARRANCKIKLYSKFISSSSTKHTITMQVIGADEKSIERCNKVIERIWPKYKKRKFYRQKTVKYNNEVSEDYKTISPIAQVQNDRWNETKEQMPSKLEKMKNYWKRKYMENDTESTATTPIVIKNRLESESEGDNVSIFKNNNHNEDQFTNNSSVFYEGIYYSDGVFTNKKPSNTPKLISNKNKRLNPYSENYCYHQTSLENPIYPRQLNPLGGYLDICVPQPSQTIHMHKNQGPFSNESQQSGIETMRNDPARCTGSSVNDHHQSIFQCIKHRKLDRKLDMKYEKILPKPSVETIQRENRIPFPFNPNDANLLLPTHFPIVMQNWVASRGTKYDPGFDFSSATEYSPLTENFAITDIYANDQRGGFPAGTISIPTGREIGGQSQISIPDNWTGKGMFPVVPDRKTFEEYLPSGENQTLRVNSQPGPVILVGSKFVIQDQERKSPSTVYVDVDDSEVGFSSERITLTPGESSLSSSSASSDYSVVSTEVTQTSEGKKQPSGTTVIIDKHKGKKTIGRQEFKKEVYESPRKLRTKDISLKSKQVQVSVSSDSSTPTEPEIRKKTLKNKQVQASIPTSKSTTPRKLRTKEILSPLSLKNKQVQVSFSSDSSTPTEPETITLKNKQVQASILTSKSTTPRQLRTKETLSPLSLINKQVQVSFSSDSSTPTEPETMEISLANKQVQASILTSKSTTPRELRTLSPLSVINKQVQVSLSSDSREPETIVKKNKQVQASIMTLKSEALETSNKYAQVSLSPSCSPSTTREINEILKESPTKTVSGMISSKIDVEEPVDYPEYPPIITVIDIYGDSSDVGGSSSQVERNRGGSNSADKIPILASIKNIGDYEIEGIQFNISNSINEHYQHEQSNDLGCALLRYHFLPEETTTISKLDVKHTFSTNKNESNQSDKPIDKPNIQILRHSESQTNNLKINNVCDNTRIIIRSMNRKGEVQNHELLVRLLNGQNSQAQVSTPKFNDSNVTTSENSDIYDFIGVINTSQNNEFKKYFIDDSNARMFCNNNFNDPKENMKFPYKVTKIEIPSGSDINNTGTPGKVNVTLDGGEHFEDLLFDPERISRMFATHFTKTESVKDYGIPCPDECTHRPSEVHDPSHVYSTSRLRSDNMRNIIRRAKSTIMKSISQQMESTENAHNVIYIPIVALDKKKIMHTADIDRLYIERGRTVAIDDVYSDRAKENDVSAMKWERHQYRLHYHSCTKPCPPNQENYYTYIPMGESVSVQPLKYDIHVKEYTPNKVDTFRDVDNDLRNTSTARSHSEPYDTFDQSTLRQPYTFVETEELPEYHPLKIPIIPMQVLPNDGKSNLLFNKSMTSNEPTTFRGDRTSSYMSKSEVHFHKHYPLLPLSPTETTYTRSVPVPQRNDPERYNSPLHYHPCNIPMCRSSKRELSPIPSSYSSEKKGKEFTGSKSWTISTANERPNTRLDSRNSTSPGTKPVDTCVVTEQCHTHERMNFVNASDYRQPLLTETQSVHPKPFQRDVIKSRDETVLPIQGEVIVTQRLQFFSPCTWSSNFDFPNMTATVNIDGAQTTRTLNRSRNTNNRGETFRFPWNPRIAVESSSAAELERYLINPDRNINNQCNLLKLIKLSRSISSPPKACFTLKQFTGRKRSFSFDSACYNSLEINLTGVHNASGRNNAIKNTRNFRNIPTLQHQYLGFDTDLQTDNYSFRKLCGGNNIDIEESVTKELIVASLFNAPIKSITQANYVPLLSDNCITSKEEKTYLSTEEDESKSNEKYSSSSSNAIGDGPLTEIQKHTDSSLRNYSGKEIKRVFDGIIHKFPLKVNIHPHYDRSLTETHEMNDKQDKNSVSCTQNSDEKDSDPTHTQNFILNGQSTKCCTSKKSNRHGDQLSDESSTEIEFNEKMIEDWIEETVFDEKSDLSEICENWVSQYNIMSSSIPLNDRLKPASPLTPTGDASDWIMIDSKPITNLSSDVCSPREMTGQASPICNGIATGNLGAHESKRSTRSTSQISMISEQLMENHSINKLNHLKDKESDQYHSIYRISCGDEDDITPDVGQNTNNSTRKMCHSESAVSKLRNEGTETHNSTLINMSKKGKKLLKCQLSNVLFCNIPTNNTSSNIKSNNTSKVKLLKKYVIRRMKSHKPYTSKSHTLNGNRWLFSLVSCII